MKHLKKWNSYIRINENKTKKTFICGFIVNGVELQDSVAFEISDSFEDELYDYLGADGISDPIRLDFPVFVEEETLITGDNVRYAFKRVNNIKELVERKIRQDIIESVDQDYLNELNSIGEVKEVRICRFMVRKTTKRIIPCKMVSIRFSVDGKESDKFGFSLFITKENLPKFIELYKKKIPVPSDFPIIYPSETIDSYGKGVRKTKHYDSFGDFAKDRTGINTFSDILLKDLRIFDHGYSFDLLEKEII